MKKILIVLSVIVAMSVMLLAGCGQEKTSERTPEDFKDNVTVFSKHGTAPQAGWSSVPGSLHNEYGPSPGTIHHPEEGHWETKVIPAYDEEVVLYHYCLDCGARK